MTIEGQLPLDDPSLHRRQLVGTFDLGGFRHAGILSGAVVLALSASVALADPYLPADDSVVLVTMPRTLLASRDEMATLRRQLAADPRNLELVTTVAGRYLELGKLEGDPRFLGYAQAAIQPWWDAASAPAAVLKLRAKLKEKDHRYDAALADLKLLLDQEPRDTQAWIELSNICRVQGNYAAARQAGDTLSEFAGTVPTMICQAPIMAVTGQAEDAYTLLTNALPRASKEYPSVVQWILTMQADTARALGRDEQAEAHYLEGLSNEPNDSYLLRAYADFLLDRNREGEVLPLVEEQLRDNGILLRAAIAAHRTGDTAKAATWTAQLESRFEELRLRGNEPHGRFEARYWLELKDDPESALTVALANWQKQKEARDTRNVLEAAVAANDPSQVQQVLQFLNDWGTEDVELERLAQKLEGE